MSVATVPQSAIERTFSSRIRAIAISAVLVTGAAALVTAPADASGDAGSTPAVQTGQAR